MRFYSIFLHNLLFEKSGFQSPYAFGVHLLIVIDYIIGYYKLWVVK